MKIYGRRPSVAAWIGVTIILVNVLAVLFSPWLAPHGEADLVGDVWAPPSADAWLGLDNLGRDMLSRLLIGGRTSVLLALLITFVEFTIGVVAGLAAASMGRWIDFILSRLVDVLMSIPQLILALIVLSVLGTSIPVLVGTVAIIESTRVFRLTRAVAMNISTMEFVEVARLRGEGLWWIMRREILPNATTPLIAEFGLRFCFALLFIASLSFLGLGVQPPNADWGSMVRDNATAVNLGSIAPLVPAGAIAFLTIGVNLLVDWFLSVNSHSHGENA